MQKRLRNWCALCQYKGKPKSFVFGTVQAESYEAARAKLLDLWREIVPFAEPETFSPMPGQLLFKEDADEDYN